MIKIPLLTRSKSCKKGRGERAEQFASKYLEQQGLDIIERNYNTRRGEIDIIAMDKETMVFVEVRLRTHGGFGGAAQSIDPRKQARLVCAAQHYLQINHLTDAQPCRFDAICLNSINTSSADKELKPENNEVDWIRDAFRPQA